ncbi:MAG TPA: hypothetical protein VFL66_06310 [Gaiellaceae bacterium]|nr:hypothetical protein [Gaiellaceae bacterium]
MRRALGHVAGGLALATVVLVALLLVNVVRRELVLHVYLLVVAALAMLGALAATRAAAPRGGRSAFETALRRVPPDDERPPQLARVERGVTLGVAHAFELHARLRPQLREAAEARLAVRRGIALDSPAARAALGDEAWELLRPDAEPPDDRFAPGVEPERLRRVVETLENL